jgi:hypothetical protein
MHPGPNHERTADMIDENDPPDENEPSESQRERISLDAELATLEFATRGAEILAGQLDSRAYVDEESERDASSSIRCVLALVGVRMELLREVVRGEKNPALLLGPHNVVYPDQVLMDDSDIWLTTWGPAKKLH